jgi:pyruvate oxidase
VIQALKKKAANNAIICSDVGDHTYWFYKRFVCEQHQTFLCANMAGMEFMTAVYNKLPITVIVFNDGKLKNIKKEQESYGYPEYRVSFTNPNMAEMAKSSGGLGIRVEDPLKLDPALEEAFDSSQPAIVEVMVDSDVYINAVRR